MTGNPNLTLVSVRCCGRARVCLDRRSETQIFVDPGRLWELILSLPKKPPNAMILSVSVSMRKSAVFIYHVPSFFGSEGGYELIATSRATSRLSSDEYLLTYSDQLVKHPYYMYTRPGGCSFCLMANVSFTPDSPESEITWLTTFNLACLTNFMPCRALGPATGSTAIRLACFLRTQMARVSVVPVTWP